MFWLVMLLSKFTPGSFGESFDIFFYDAFLRSEYESILSLIAEKFVLNQQTVEQETNKLFIKYEIFFRD